MFSILTLETGFRDFRIPFIEVFKFYSIKATYAPFNLYSGFLQCNVCDFVILTGTAGFRRGDRTCSGSSKS